VWDIELGRQVETMAKNKATTRKRVARKPVSIKELDLSNRDSRAAFDQILSRVDKQFKRVTDPIRESQRLSKDDFAVRINARG
jgi:hypothetical protein